MIPAYIEARIRRSPPEGLDVIPGSTPVLAFGNARSARVATLGLNPSRIEFVEKGVFLHGDKRRLATHASLGVSGLATASPEVIAEVLHDCDNYFHRRPYRFWFDKLETVLNRCGSSYYDGTACHLDLVQWATDPTWSGLGEAARRTLTADDADFLANQLQNEAIRLLLVNGAAVWRELQKAMLGRLTVTDEEVISGFSRHRTCLSSGLLFGKVSVVGWSTNLQSSFGVTRSLREELGRRTADRSRSTKQDA